jgi:class 3 adenylate cyclase
MWEKLPMALMQQVIHVHHTTLRALLDKHNGYESATEGDSFIIAFHSPAAAIAFAAAAQKALLTAAWPQQLLDSFEEAAAHDALVVCVPKPECSLAGLALGSCW